MTGNYQIFYAAYAATMPSMYFNRVLMVSRFAQHPDPVVKQVFTGQFNYLRETGGDNVELIKRATDIAGSLDIGTKPMPRLPDDYFDWIKFYHDGFERAFDITSTEYHCFVFSRKVAEAMVNLGLMQTALIFTTHSNKQVSFVKEIDNWVKEFDSITLLMLAPTVMLARATGKNCFEELKEIITNGSAELNRLSITTANEETIAQFTSKVDSMLHQINLSFQGCVAALKEA